MVLGRERDDRQVRKSACNNVYKTDGKCDLVWSGVEVPAVVLSQSLQ